MGIRVKSKHELPKIYILLYNVNGKFLLMMARTCQRFVTYTLGLRYSAHFPIMFFRLNNKPASR